jgi:hypothetical protein
VSEAVVLWEREVVSAAIVALLERAAAGTAGALFINGDPGLGKRALVDRARRLASERGFLVGSGRGDPMEVSLPFGLFMQAFGELGGASVLQDAGSGLAGADVRGAQFYGRGDGWRASGRSRSSSPWMICTGQMPTRCPCCPSCAGGSARCRSP